MSEQSDKNQLRTNENSLSNETQELSLDQTKRFLLGLMKVRARLTAVAIYAWARRKNIKIRNWCLDQALTEQVEIGRLKKKGSVYFRVF